MSGEVGFGHSYPARPCPEIPASAEYVAGFEAADALRRDNPARTDWNNPFPQGSDQWRGFEEGVYVFAGK